MIKTSYTYTRSSRLYKQWALLVLTLLLTFSQPVRAYESEGSYLLLSLSDLQHTSTPLQPGGSWWASWGVKPGWIRVVAYNDSVKTCANFAQNYLNPLYKRSTQDFMANPELAMHDVLAAINHVSVLKILCTGDIRKLNKLRIIIVTTDTSGWGEGTTNTGVTFDLDLLDGSVGPIPTVTCNAVAGLLDFGVVEHGAGESGGAGGLPTATGSVTVDCDSNTHLHLDLKDKGPFVDTVSGAHIEFSGDMDYEVCGGTCVFDIMGTMSIAPSSPGRYQWGVPITISYE